MIVLSTANHCKHLEISMYCPDSNSTVTPDLSYSIVSLLTLGKAKKHSVGSQYITIQLEQLYKSFHAPHCIPDTFQ